VSLSVNITSHTFVYYRKVTESLYFQGSHTSLSHADRWFMAASSCIATQDDCTHDYTWSTSL